MKFLKLYLFKLSSWWKYLFFCGLFIFINKNCLAYTNDYGFDVIFPGTPIQLSQWGSQIDIKYDRFSNSSCVSATSTEFKAGNSSLTRTQSTPNCLMNVSASSSKPTEFSFYSYIPTSANSGAGGVVHLYTATTSIASFQIDYLSSSVKWCNAGCGIIYKSGGSRGIWYKNTLKISSSTMDLYVDDIFVVSVAKPSTDIERISLTSSHTISDYFVDEMQFIDNTIDYSVDDIVFINPVDQSIQSLNDFYWEYNLKIASSTYWTTYDFLKVDLIFVHYTNSVADATTTLSVLREPMNTFVPNTYYNFQITDINAFPTQLGTYGAAIGLKGVYSNGTTDLLASDIVAFGIATTTPINPTAWCSGLCNDIATATDWTGQIGNGANCALRSAMCYLFSPHQYNLDQFNTQYNNFKLVFPFNTFFDLASTTQNAFASSTINNNQTVGFPNIRKTGTTTEYYIQPLLSSSTMASFIGLSNATLFRNTISYLLYGLTAGAIFLIIW
jgi:hypothetical protein